MAYELKNVLEKIVSKSFPELKKRKINIEYAKMGEKYFGFNGNGKGYEIYVSTKIKNASKKIIIGGIVHELCHIVNEINLSRYMKSKDLNLYKKNSHYRKLDEKYTDLLVIMRGYRPQLIELTKKCGKKNEGLTLEEVKKLLKK